MILDKPWGRVTTYTLNQPGSVRVIEVEPEASTSLHYHRLRDELWVILDPGLKIVIGDEEKIAEPGEEFVIPAERTHRIISTGPRGRVLEIAYGYTTEDDVQRLEDEYGRPDEGEW